MRNIPALGLLILLLHPSSADAEETARWWVHLPRAEVPASLEGWPVAPEPGERAMARRAARGDARRIDQLHRGPDPVQLRELAVEVERIRTVSRWLGAVSVEATPAQVARVRARFGSASVRPVLRFRRDLPLDPTPLGSSKVESSEYGPSAKQLEQIQVDQLHGLGLTGCGVRILVLDTGFFRDIPVLEQVDVVAEKDFIQDDADTANEPGEPSSQHNHGTGVLAVMGGYSPGNLVGPALGAEYLLAKTENVASETQVEEDDFVAALEWGEALGADVMSASLGYISFDDGFTYPPEAFDGDTAVTTVAVDALAAMGVLPVVAAGNRGNQPSTLLTPADADSSLTVGSVDSLDVVSPFSSRGPTYDNRIKPDIAARGRLTVWARPDSTFGLANGTSLATPLVAGAVALLMEANPGWNPMDLLGAIQATGSQAGTPDNNRGYGVMRAFDALMTAPPQAPFPVALEVPADQTVGTGPGETFRWTAAVDLQTPGDVDYTVEAASDAAFTNLLGSWAAGPDTTLSISPLPPGPFHWRVRSEDPQGHTRWSRARVFTPGEPTGVGTPLAPDWARLGPPTPNPFNPAVTVRLSLDRPGRARVDIYDLAGRRVRVLWEGPMTLGDRLLRWDGRDGTGRAVGSGVYLVRARVESAGLDPLETTRRMVLLR